MTAMNLIRPAGINLWSPIAAIALTLGMFSIPGIPPVWAQEQQSRLLTVTGQGIVNVPTSLAQVSLGVEVQANTAQQAQQEVARRSQAVVELLRSRNVEKLETTGIQLSPLYSNRPNQPSEIVGYSASNIVSFRLSTERAGALLDEAVNAGASRIDGISFVATDEAMSVARQQAIQSATQDALDQADTVLSTLNLTRREIFGINVNADIASPQPLLQRAEAFDKFSTPVIGGDRQVSASVTLQVRY